MPQPSPSLTSRSVTRHSLSTSSDRTTLKKARDTSHSEVQPAPPRTIDSLRNQVADEIALKALRKLENIDGIKIVVLVTSAGRGDVNFLHHIADAVEARWRLSTSSYLFILAAAPPSPSTPLPQPLVVCASKELLLSRAELLIGAKLTGRVAGARHGNRWIATVRDAGARFDEDALWDVVRKAARTPVDPRSPPPGSMGAMERVAAARAKLERVSPVQALAELHSPRVEAPTLLVDIRGAAEREAGGVVPGSIAIERGELEWRLDPRNAARLSVVDRYDLRVLLMSWDGGASSLAAISLHELGLLNATDIVGGFAGWVQAGLPVDGGLGTDSISETTASMSSWVNI
ncbi:hypothetical protein BD626DRAFT_410704 [Schizophyllum amplum]|uniref:Rhodanese domain-containing protein n=1 Tax=Schizophyllum amplum TaxID=97359 RepID=A0A550C0E7_9AGAR|nr:hypothetical protein BD626DRAFT_410704 [Auriculariopsis ampla]